MQFHKYVHVTKSWIKWFSKYCWNQVSKVGDDNISEFLQTHCQFDEKCQSITFCFKTSNIRSLNCRINIKQGKLVEFKCFYKNCSNSVLKVVYGYRCLLDQFMQLNLHSNTVTVDQYLQRNDKMWNLLE